MRRSVVIRTVINGFTFDGATKDPMQQAVRDALIAFMAAMSQAQAEATKAAQRAGIEHAKQKDERVYLGRKPSYTREQFDKVRDMLARDAVGIAQVAKEMGLTRQTVYRIKYDPAARSDHFQVRETHERVDAAALVTFSIEDGKPRSSERGV
jgi:DNA invertase Pin-like site-specific DNA recombinase